MSKQKKYKQASLNLRKPKKKSRKGKCNALLARRGCPQNVNIDLIITEDENNTTGAASSVTPVGKAANKFQHVRNKSADKIEHSLFKKLENYYCFKNGWCKFWNPKTIYNDSKRLPSVFIKELKPIFERLSGDDLLKRCLKGHTQNQN